MLVNNTHRLSNDSGSTMQMSCEKPDEEHSQAIQVTPASLDDIPERAPVMKRAFDDDSQKHLGKPWGGPEGYDDGGFFRR